MTGLKSNNIFKIAAILILINCIETTLFCQKNYTKTDVRNMFPTNTKNLWINYLTGTIDNKHTADMIIGTDGHTCKGLYTLRSSNTTFFFDGVESEKQLKLAEINKESKLTGFLYGKYDGEVFDGIWTDGRRKLSLPLKLTFVNAFQKLVPTIKVENLWNRIYSGLVSEQPVKLQLTRDQNTFTGIVTDKTNIRQKMSVEAKGNQVELIKLDFNDSVLSDKLIMLDTSNLEKISIIYPDSNGYDVVNTLKSEESLDYTICEYADYHSRLVCSMPLTNNKRFNKWINTAFKNWLDESLIKLRAVGSEDVGTNDRWILSAQGWVDIYLFDSDIISGNIYMQSSWYNQTEKIPFIYDLKYGKLLELKDIFDNKFDSKEYFRNLIPEMIKSITWSDNAKSWVLNQSFNHICLKDEGICFSTSFNTIYGEKEIIIPYSTVEQNLKSRYFFVK
ncbi:MAG: hypothetical protein WBP08_04610 [Saprospiraceae bacterium]